MLNSTGKTFAFFTIILANVIYGLNYVIAKGIMPEYLSPKAIIFLRIAGTLPIAFVCFFVFVNEKIKFSDIPRFMAASFFGIALNQTMFFEGLNLTTPIDSAIIMTANPVLVMVFSYFILKDKISLLKVAGIVLGISGAILIITGKGEISFNSNTFTGNILILINATSFALYLVIVKPLISKYHPMTIMVWTFVFGFLMTFPITIVPFINSDFSSIPFSIWASLLYVIIGATFLGYLLYNYSLKVLSPTIVSFFIYLQPLFSTLTTMAVYGDKPSLIDYLSALLIFTGVWLVSKNSIQKKTN